MLNFDRSRLFQVSLSLDGFSLARLFEVPFENSESVLKVQCQNSESILKVQCLLELDINYD